MLGTTLHVAVASGSWSRQLILLTAFCLFTNVALKLVETCGLPPAADALDILSC